jgi:2-methylcitrate dehydratase
MTQAESLGKFVQGCSFNDLSREARKHLRIRILDALGCAIGGIGGQAVANVIAEIDELGGNGLCTLIGGKRTSPDRAALGNGALVRYLDFNDSYLAKGETCHPSDNFGAILAACEYAGRSGRDLMTALSISYQVQCRLSDEAPVRARGFDHTVQGMYGLSAGIAKALDLGEDAMVNAIAIAGTAFNALRVTRTGSLSQWKGLAYPNAAFSAMHAAFLAKHGVTGPREVFEGNKGFMDSIAGKYQIDWAKENLESVTRTIVKKFNAEIHSQSAIEGILEIKSDGKFQIEDIQQIDLEIFDVAYNIIGGGEEGDKTRVRTKEEADHSLPYMLSVALLDGQVMPDQYRLERIQRSDVQTLLKKIRIKPTEDLSRRFPQEMACRLKITLRDGRVLSKDKRDYEGFLTRPISFESAQSKFEKLSLQHTDRILRNDIISAVRNLEEIQTRDLVAVLARVRQEEISNG